jgi:hypothetical protein
MTTSSSIVVKIGSLSRTMTLSGRTLACVPVTSFTLFSQIKCRQKSTPTPLSPPIISFDGRGENKIRAEGWAFAPLRSATWRRVPKSLRFG